MMAILAGILVVGLVVVFGFVLVGSDLATAAGFDWQAPIENLWPYVEEPRDGDGKGFSDQVFRTFQGFHSY